MKRYLSIFLWVGTLVLNSLNLQAQCVADFSFNTSPSSLKVDFTDSSSYPVSLNMNFSWWFGDGTASSNLQNPIYSFSQPGTYLVNLSIYDSANTCFDSTSRYVTVPAPPPTSCQAAYSYSISPNGLNSIVNFTNQSSSYSDSSTFILDFGDGDSVVFNSTNAGLVRQKAYLPGTYIVKLSILDSAWNNSCSYADTLVIPSNLPPCTADFNYQISPFGNNSRVDFINTSTNFTDSSVFSFDFGNGGTMTFPATNGNLNAQRIFSPGNYQVSLSIIDSTYNLSCIKTDTLDIPIRQNCSAGFTFQEIGDSVFFSSTAQNFTSIKYYFGDGDSSSLENPIHQYAQSNQYVVEQIVFDSLSNCTNSYRDTLTVSISTSCLAAYTPAIDTTKQNLLYLVNQSSKGTNHQYYWDFGDGGSSSTRNPTHHYQDYGSYQICLRVSDGDLGCVNTFCDTLGLDSNNNVLNKSNGFALKVLDGGAIGLSEQADKMGVAVYPNPFRGLLNIRFEEQPLNTQFEIIGMNGKIFKQGRMLDLNNELQLDHLKEGIYLLKIESEGQIKIVKLIKGV